MIGGGLRLDGRGGVTVPGNTSVSPEDRAALRRAFVQRMPEMRDMRRQMRADFAGLLAARVQQGDASAFEDYKRVNERIKALKSTPPV